MAESVYVLEMDGISKYFPGVKALDNVRLKLRKGDVLGLIGENGAGKSTLMKILLGMQPPDTGKMILKGRAFKPKSPADALKQWISMIHQEISLVHTMTVAENVWIGRENEFLGYGLLDKKKRTAATRELFDKYKINIDPDTEVAKLSIANMQLVEVARAISYNSDIIIMDEPTSALTNTEIDMLYRIIGDLRNAGKSIIFISHKLEELFAICSRVTVLRDGQYVATSDINDIDTEALIKQMVGREITDLFPKEDVELGDVVLEVRNLSRNGSFSDINFSVRKGEILGFCGLMGAQRTEIMQAIFGIDKIDSGTIILGGREIKNKTVKDAIGHKFAMVTEDRLRRGVIHKLPVRVNMSLAFLKKVCRFGFVKRKLEAAYCKEMVDKMQIKVSSMEQVISSLSGGNQQKVIIGKWLLTQPDVLILDEPTRGIDVGSKADIYRLIGEMAKMHKAVLVVSSELPEVMGISDRILVIREGRIVAEKQRHEFAQDTLMAHAFGL